MSETALSPSDARRWTLVGLLCALSLLLGYLETFVPLPIPGARLGLANIPVLIALHRHDLRGACWVAALKVLAAGLLFGNPVTLAYSALGTALALVTMMPLSLLPTMRLEMVSVTGALAHEAGQLVVAQLLLGTPLVWYGAPLLAATGCATGLLCGVVALRTARLLDRQAPASMAPSPDATPPAPDRTREAPASRASLSAMVRPAAYLAFVVAVMHAATAWQLAGCLAVAAVAAARAGVSARAAGGAMLHALPIVLVTLVAQVASAQGGHVLLLAGPVAVTTEAIESSVGMALRLVSITLGSLAVVAGAGRAQLGQAAQLMLVPLEALGVDTAGPRLALGTAFGVLPQLADLAEEEVGLHDLLSPGFWREGLPLLVSRLWRQALAGRPS